MYMNGSDASSHAQKKKRFRKLQTPLRWVHVQMRVDRVEFFGGGGCLSKSFQSHRGCNRYTDTPSHPAHLDANPHKGYSALPSRLSSAVCGDWSSSKPGSGWSRKLLSWQRDCGFDPHPPLRQTKLARADGFTIMAVGYAPHESFLICIRSHRWPDDTLRPTNQYLIRRSSALFPSTLV
jgi:hypothetical protein